MSLLRSWLDSANDPTSDFPLNNLPLGVFSNAAGPARCGVAIGDRIVDVAAMEEAGFLKLADRPLLKEPAWNAFLAAGPEVWERLRILLIGFLAEGSAQAGQIEPFLCPREPERAIFMSPRRRAPLFALQGRRIHRLLRKP